MQLHVAI